MKCVMLVLCLATPVSAQPWFDRGTPAFPTERQRDFADVASWATVITTVVLDSKASWDCPDRQRCFVLQGVRTGVTYGSVYLVKTLFRRARPCAPQCDEPLASFYSAHTALAFQSLGGPRLAFMLPLAISTGGLRIGANKHYLSDVVVGAVAGLLTSRIR